MKALVFKDNELRLESDYPRPRRSRGEALVRVTVAGICATDLEIVKGYMEFEGVLGHEFTGVVEEDTSGRWLGKRVAGEINAGCGGCGWCEAGLANHCPGRTVLGIAGRDGAFAEYLTLPEANLHALPDGISDQEAVFVEPLAAAFEILEQVDISSKDSVCVLGDGRLGLLTAQVLAGRTESLLAAGRHREKLAILQARGIKTALGGARPVGIGSKQNVSRFNGETGEQLHEFDFVVDCTGDAGGLEAALDLVRPRGTIILKTTAAGQRPADLNRVVVDEITLIGSRCGPFPPAIQALAKKEIDVKNMISAVFPFDEAHRAMRAAAQQGALKVLLTMAR
ncbi:MAG: alcohol dehydrogenase catalytic domain-containing protein [Actinobacteria bacterium]|nr:alcohol dehydrogenase catalytic domain-containing protein [Actinomycetota bacterium]